MVCVSKTSGFTKSHVKYLEWYCHQEAEAAGRFKMDNSTIPTKSYVSEPMVADLMDHFDTIRILTSTLGYPMFEKIQKPGMSDVVTCKGKKALAKGEYTEDGLIVFANSIVNRPEAKSMHSYVSMTREQMIDHGILEVVDEQTLRFTKDHVFPSPSQAAAVVLGRNANGWVEWKYPDGRTLDEVKRKGGS